jgi:uncharacterized protein YjbJ (UPF0337 family)
MDREHVKGAADKAKGAVKQGAGKLTGDKEMEREADKAKGGAHKAAGNVKDAARNAADSLKSKCGMDRACRAELEASQVIRLPRQVLAIFHRSLRMIARLNAATVSRTTGLGTPPARCRVSMSACKHVFRDRVGRPA